MRCLRNNRAPALLLAMAMALPSAVAAEEAPTTAPAPAPATAASAPATANARLAIREATAAAYAMLYQRVRQLRVTPDVRVETFLALDPNIRAATWAAIARLAQADAPQRFGDGVTSVQVHVELRQVIDQLKTACTTDVATNAFKPQDFNQVLLYTDRKSLWGYGQAEGKPRLAFADPAPVGWYDVGVFGRLSARRQATRNAHYRLLARARGLRYDPATKIATFIDSDKRVAADLMTFIRSRPDVGPPRYLPQRVCEVDLTLRVGELVTELKALSLAYHDGPKFAPEKFDGVSTHTTESSLRVTGVAVPLADAPIAMAIEETVLIRTAEAAPPEHVEDAEQARLLAFRAAVAQCRERLRQELLDQPTPGDTDETLAQVVSGIPGALRDIDALLGSLRVVQVKDIGSRRVRVTTELPTGRLPAIVAHYRRLKAEAAKDTSTGKRKSAP